MFKFFKKNKPKVNIVPQIADHRMWLFNKDGGRIFEKGEMIPVGYKDTPVK